MPDRGPVRVRGAWLVRAMIPLATFAGVAALATDEILWTLTGPTSVTFDWRGAPSPKQNFVVCVEDDSGDAIPYPHTAAVQSAIARDDPWFVLVVGDLTHADDRGLEAVDRHFIDVMAWSCDAGYLKLRTCA